MVTHGINTEEDLEIFRGLDCSFPDDTVLMMIVNVTQGYNWEPEVTGTGTQGTGKGNTGTQGIVKPHYMVPKV